MFEIRFGKETLFFDVEIKAIKKNIKNSISERYKHKSAFYSSEIITNISISERYNDESALYSSENIEWY